MGTEHPSKSWSIHTRSEIIAKYKVMERIGSGAYADVYRGRRLSDDLTVALKEIHDYQSAFREIEALQMLQGSSNVIVMHEYFCREDEDAVLVLEYLTTDLATVISNAAKEGFPLPVGEMKRWMIQIISGLDACHRNMIVHRDLKPSNLLISDSGVLKLADFGQVNLFTLIILNSIINLKPHYVRIIYLYFLRVLVVRLYIRALFRTRSLFYFILFYKY